MGSSRVLICRWRSPGDPTCSVKSYGYTPRYVAKLRYREVRASSGRRVAMELRLALENVKARYSDVEKSIDSFIENIVVEKPAWLGILNDFMLLAMRLAPPRTTPSAEVKVMDTGGKFPVVEISAVYMG